MLRDKYCQNNEDYRYWNNVAPNLLDKISQPIASLRCKIFLSENLRNRLPGGVYTTTGLPCLQTIWSSAIFYIGCTIMQKLAAKFKVCNPRYIDGKTVNQNV